MLAAEVDDALRSRLSYYPDDPILGLTAWEKSIADKLEVLQEMYNVLVQRVTTARAELVELTIIVLIAVEMILFLAGWGF